MRCVLVKLSVVSLVAFSGAAASAQSRPVRVTFENLAPTNSVSYAALRFGFGTGTFDAFDEGQTAFLLGAASIAQAPIVSVAEGGTGATWFPAFTAAEAGPNFGSIFGPTRPQFLPGQSNSTVVDVDLSNRFFTFAQMLLPSNDHFVGNDDPMEYEVLDAAGNLLISSITQDASEIWDAGSETQNPANAAFLVGGVNPNRENENEVVRFLFSNLSAFDGLTTAAGYTFDSSLLSSSTDVLRISFEIVPEPASFALVAGAGLLAMRRRNR